MSKFEHEILGIDVDSIRSATGIELDQVVTNIVAQTKAECEAGDQCGMFAVAREYSYEKAIHYGVAGWGMGTMTPEQEAKYPDSETVWATKLVSGCKNNSCTAEFCALNSLRRLLAELGPRSTAVLREANSAADVVSGQFAERYAELERTKAQLDEERLVAIANARIGVLNKFRGEINDATVRQEV